MNRIGKYYIDLKRLAGLFLFLVFSLYSHYSFSQNQTLADSIEKIYNSSTKAKKDLVVLRELAINSSDPVKKIKYSNELIELATKKDSTIFLYSGYLHKGYALSTKGDYTEALNWFFKAAAIAETEKEQASIKVAIGDIYSYTDNHGRSIEYYDEAITIFRKINDSLKLGSTIFNAGDEYLKDGQVEKAISYLEEAEEIFKEIKFDTGLIYSLGTLGLAYAKQGRNEEAERNIEQAIQALEKSEDYGPICEFLNGMSDIYTEKGQDSLAIEFASLSRELARSYGFKNEILASNLKLSQIYEKTGDIPKSYKFYKEYITYRDSIMNVAKAQEMAGLRADYEVSQKQAEIDLLSQQRKNQQTVVISIAAVSILVGLLAFGLYRRNRYINRTSRIIEKERNRAERLLLNILPEQTAEELKKNGRVKAKKFASVTVLFADFKRFTLVAEKLPPERLIKTIDYYFSYFDKITDKYGIEKIKTIGDSYMAVSGLPYPSHDHATRMLLAAFEMTEFVKETKEKSLFDDADFEVRIGLNSGPVVAGVVGTKKFAYDIWGDTVNIAARMESHSEIGRINISENTYDLIKDEFECEYRGKVEVKNQRILKMYYVNAVKEGVSKKAV